MHHDISPDITEFYMCMCFSLYIRIKEALVKYDDKLSPDRKISDAIDNMLEYTQLTGQRKHGYKSREIILQMILTCVLNDRFIFDIILSWIYIITNSLLFAC